MCLVIDCSEKSLKSDYFGAIICNWWRKVRKIRIFTEQNAYFTENSYEHPEYSGFLPLKHTVERFHAEYTENSGHSMKFFQKIGKFTLFSVKLNTNLTLWVENSKKIGFFSITSTNF